MPRGTDTGRRKNIEGHGKVVARHERVRDGAAVGWRLAARKPIRVFDEYSDRTIELEPGQKDPGAIEGLLIDFRYVASDGETTRRLLLCWQCGRDRKRTYVRGYCPFREELRTFRVDRMFDVIALQGTRDIPVNDIGAFFSAYAAEPTAEGNMRSLQPPE